MLAISTLHVHLTICKISIENETGNGSNSNDNEREDSLMYLPSSTAGRIFGLCNTKLSTEAPLSDGRLSCAIGCFWRLARSLCTTKRMSNFHV